MFSCPHCHRKQASRGRRIVQKTTKGKGYIRRRRKCGACGVLFSTVEILAAEHRRLQRADKLIAKLK